jgi:hypothetical protein
VLSCCMPPARQHGAPLNGLAARNPRYCSLQAHNQSQRAVRSELQGCSDRKYRCAVWSKLETVLVYMRTHGA